jgi:tetratricopeptide (TPR) repeat protein
MIRSVLFYWIIASSLLPCAVKAQDLHQSFRFAVQQLELPNYDLAVQLFERVIFFDSTNSYPQVYRYLAESYAILGEYAEAEQYFQIAFLNESNDSSRMALLFQKTQCQLLQGKYQQAIVTLMGMNTGRTLYFSQKKNYYLGLTYFLAEDYEKSKNYLLKWSAFHEHRYDATLEELFALNEKVNKINPRRAMWMSVFLPGLGQARHGYWQSGLNSFLLTAGITTAYLAYLNTFTLIEGYLIVIPWFQRYHRGGYMNAERLAEERILQRRKVIFTEINNLPALM